MVYIIRKYYFHIILLKQREVNFISDLCYLISVLQSSKPYILGLFFLNCCTVCELQ